MTDQRNSKAIFRCFHGCPGEYSLDAAIYTCPQCDGLLDVWHDFDALKKRTGEAWRALFDSRYKLRATPSWQMSGIWSKREWVLPNIAGDNIVSLGEGNTPLLQSKKLAKQIGIEKLRVKLCGNSHSGSFKDLGMTVLVSQVKQMIAGGKNIRAVACASTGDTSAALAAYCAAANIPAVVLLPENKISTAQLIQPLANGALTLALRTDFDGCMAVVKELAKVPEIYLANSMNSLRIEGQKTIAIEICQQLDWQAPDWVVVPGGNLGNISAIGKGFEMAFEMGLVDRKPKLVCAQAEHANPLYESYKTGFREFHSKTAQKTLASAIQIGNPVSVQKAIRVLKKFDGIVEQAGEGALAGAAAQADRAGFFCCPQTGVALAVAQKLAARGIINRSETVVIISTAHGLNFTDFKQAYHTQQVSEIGPKFANKPIVSPAKLDAVLHAVEQRLS
jgi:threonine synthase